MTRFYNLDKFLLLAITAAPFAAAHAQVVIPPDPDPTRLANAPVDAEPKADWQFRVGGGLIYAPAFLGSKDYQLRGGPDFEVRYKNRFFLSVIDGAGVDIVKSGGFRAGPVVKYAETRKESGKELFVISGKRTTALKGLGDVGTTVEAGGYIQYEIGNVSAKMEVRKGIGGHKGLIADLGARYTTSLPMLSVNNLPIIFSMGPRATIVDSKYDSAYFGVTALQSARSGLPEYTAKGGLLSFGVGSAIIVPMTSQLSVAILAGYDRLSGDAGRSPLVLLRGSRNQASGGIGFTYRFGR